MLAVKKKSMSTIFPTKFRQKGRSNTYKLGFEKFKAEFIAKTCTYEFTKTEYVKLMR